MVKQLSQAWTWIFQECIVIRTATTSLQLNFEMWTSFPRVTTILSVSRSYWKKVTRSQGLRRMVCLLKKEDGSLSLTSESKLQREYCGVHTFDDLKTKENSLQE